MHQVSGNFFFLLIYVNLWFYKIVSKAGLVSVSTPSSPNTLRGLGTGAGNPQGTWSRVVVGFELSLMGLGAETHARHAASVLDTREAPHLKVRYNLELKN